MNTSKWLLLGLTLLFPSVGWSQSPSATTTDLQKLQAQRERALATAAAPIERQYRAALEQLLKASMQRGDLDGANAVKAALAAVSASTTSSTAAKPGLGAAAGAKRFAGTKWMRARLFVTFEEDGSFRYVYGNVTKLDGVWKATSSTAVEATSTDGKATFKYEWESDKLLVDPQNNKYTPYSADGMSSPQREPKDPGSPNDPHENPFGKR